MQITKEELINALDNLHDPYPAFTDQQDIDQFYATLPQLIRTEFGISEDLKEEEFAESIEDEIHDDVQNCGRNPLSKFMECAKILAYLKHFDNNYFNKVMDYLTETINDHETE